MKHLFFILFLLCSYNAVAQLPPKIKDPSKLSYVEIDSLMYLEYDKDNMAACIALMELGRTKSKAEFGDMDTIYALYSSDLGYFHWQLGEYKLAEPLYLEAKKIREKVWGKEHSDYATVLNNLAILYKDMGNYDQVEALYLESKDIKEKSVGKESAAYANTVYNLAQFYKEIGNYAQAEKFYQEAISIRAKVLGKEHVDYAQSLNNLAEYYKEIGHYDKAEQLLLEAKIIYEKTEGKEHADYAMSLNNLATGYYKTGSYTLAEPLYLEAIAIWEKLAGKDHPNYAQSLNNLGILYMEMERYAEAEKLFLDAKLIKEKALGKLHPNNTLTNASLANLFVKTKKYAEAEKLYLENLTIFEKTVGKGQLNYATNLNNLSNVYQLLGDYSKAEKIQLEALEIRAQTVGKNHPSYASTLNNLMLLYQEMGNKTAAWNCMQQALESSSGMSLSTVITRAWADSLLSVTYASNVHLENLISTLSTTYQLLSKNKPKEQAIIALLANQLLQKSRTSLIGESDKLRLLAQSHDWMLRSLSVLDLNKQQNEAFEIVELNKASLLLESSKTAQAQQLGELPNELVVEEQNLLKKISKLQAGLLENRSAEEKDSLRSILNETSQKMGSLKKKIEQKFPKYAALKYQLTDAKINDIQQTLTDKSALLEYVIGDSISYVFYIDNKQVKVISIPISNAEIIVRAGRLHQVLSSYKTIEKNPELSYREYTEQAYWFYQQFVAPSLVHAKDINQLFIISDGALAHLPFETFLTKAAPQQVSDYNMLHYLMNAYKISYNYSATLWKENKTAAKPSNNGQIFALAANYKLPLDSSQLGLRLPTYQRLRAGLQPLPEAEKEVNLLKESYQGFFGLDTLATEKIFKEKAGDYAIIHLAMHGLLDSKAPILSSLVFTEDGDSLEDNFLQAYEISKLKLNTDLVVLSACETGYGKFEKGNGVASLARAFMYAGASSLVVTLWQVNDFATSEIMKNFYQNLANGLDKDEALQQAKLQYLKNAKGIMAHPAFWSPFIQMGNTDAISLKKKGGYRGALAALVVLALGIGFFAWRKKNKTTASHQ